MARFDKKELQVAFDLYEDAVCKLSHSKKYKKGEETLESLDKWYQNDLPAAVSSRNPQVLEYDELTRVMKWKLKRGKFRPALQGLVESNAAELVSKCSRAAFKQMPNVQKAIGSLTELRGVGPATASAILASTFPSEAPFMADEAVEAVLPGGGKIAYTIRGYLDYLAAMKRLVTSLNKELGSQCWTLHKLELALWSRAQCEKLGLDMSESVKKSDSLLGKRSQDSTKPVAKGSTDLDSDGPSNSKKSKPAK